MVGGGEGNNTRKQLLPPPPLFNQAALITRAWDGEGRRDKQVLPGSPHVTHTHIILEGEHVFSQKMYLSSVLLHTMPFRTT